MEGRRMRRPIEPSRIQYGAWDNPGVSIFAAISQDPMPNMMNSIKPLPKGTSDCDTDACPMVMETSPSTSAVYHMVKYQVEEMVAQRNLHNHPLEQQRRDDHEIATAMVAEKKRQIVDASIRKQLHRNVPELRDLVVEIERANTALNVKQHMEREQNERSADKSRFHNEAIDEQERLRMEIETEKSQRREKSVIFGNQLVDQIKEDRLRRQIQQQADYEEGRKERYETERQCALQEREEIDQRLNYRMRLKASMDDFAALQRSFKQANAPLSKPKPESSVLDSLGPETADIISRSLRARNDRIATRDLVSARLGFQLSQIKHEKVARDKLITGLLVREYKAKEDERVMLQAEKDLKKKLQIRDELLDQRIEQQFYRDKSKAFDKLIPYDETCFGVRQHKEATARNEAMQRLQLASYDDMSKMIIENGLRRAQAIDEQRKMCQALADMQAQQDELVRQERMRLLTNEPMEVLQALRLSALTSEEVQRFNLNDRGK